jgi:hypothetical protein
MRSGSAGILPALCIFLELEKLPARCRRYKNGASPRLRLQGRLHHTPRAEPACFSGAASSVDDK